MEIVAKINKQLEEFNAKKAELLKDLQSEFPALFTPLFEQSKKINSVGWTQYTPYFNDGDECTFRTNFDYLYINGERADDLDDEEDAFLSKGVYAKITPENIEEHKAFNSSPFGYSWYKDKKVGENGYFKNPSFDEHEYSLVEKFTGLLNSIPEDFHKELFGDHIKVTVSRDGSISTEEYSHD